MRSSKITRASSLIYVFVTVSSAALLSLLIIMSIIGTLNPRKVKIGIATETLEKQYDGTPLTSNSAVIKYGELISGHAFQAQGYCEITEVGQKENVVDFIIVDSTGTDVTEMYELNTEYGTLSVLPRKISLSTETRSKTYNGTPLTSTNISVFSGELMPGDSIVPLGMNSITEVGSISNVIPYYIANEAGKDVTDRYEIEHTYGNLTVRQRALNIKTSGASKTYDGKGITVSEWSFTGGTSIDSNEKINLVFPEFTETGEYENVPNVLITDESGSDVTSRYNITFFAGTITINKRYLAISTEGANKVYDGTPLTNKTLSIVSGSLLTDHYIKNMFFTEAVNAGVTKNIAEIVIFDSNGNEVTSCYNIACKAGDLVIRPKTITIRTGTARKKYDATPLSNNDYKLTGGSLCTGHTIDFEGSSITFPGTKQNLPTRLVIYDRLTDVTNNYIITYLYGTLTVTN